MGSSNPPRALALSHANPGLIAAWARSSQRWCSWRAHVGGQIGADEILVFAPYILQVNRLRQWLKRRARVETVDKFYGQEAPVAPVVDGEQLRGCAVCFRFSSFS